MPMEAIRLSKEPVFRNITLQVCERSDKQILLTDFITSYLKKCHKNESYKQMHLVCTKHLSSFAQLTGKQIYTDSMSEQMFEDFVYYLQECKLMSSTVKGIVQRTKSMLQKAQNANYKVNNTYHDYNFRDDEIDSIFLTMAEITRIYYYKGLTRNQEEIRDYFIVGCLTGLRYSDYSRLTAENFAEGKIQIRTKKTKTPVLIPMHRFVKEIIRKYNGTLPPARCIQYFNLAIKEICKQVGLTELVAYERQIGFDFVRRMLPKWKLVSSHTARRSAATNMFLAKIDTYRIMLLTGHKTESAFFRYIKISREENAMVLAGNQFFN